MPHYSNTLSSRPLHVKCLKITVLWHNTTKVKYFIFFNALDVEHIVTLFWKVRNKWTKGTGMWVASTFSASVQLHNINEKHMSQGCSLSHPLSETVLGFQWWAFSCDRKSQNTHMRSHTYACAHTHILNAFKTSIWKCTFNITKKVFDVHYQRFA